MGNVVFGFTNQTSLYNAIVLANNLSGSDQITIKYRTDLASSDLVGIDTNSSGSLDQSEIDAFINGHASVNGTREIGPVSASARIVRPENLVISTTPFTPEDFATEALGMAPRITKSMTIDFLSEGGDQFKLAQDSKLEIIPKTRAS